VVLCYLEGKTQDEAAKLLGVSRTTLKKRLESARALLRQRLMRGGLNRGAGGVFCCRCGGSQPQRAISYSVHNVTGLIWPLSSANPWRTSRSTRKSDLRNYESAFSRHCVYGSYARI
jgi:hypothetical protein